MRSALNIKVVVVLASTLVVVGALAYVGYTSSQNVMRLNKQWSDYVSFVSNASVKLDAIRHHVLHGGFYEQVRFVSRDSDQLSLKKLDNSRDELLGVLEDYKSHVVSERERESIHALVAVTNRIGNLVVLRTKGDPSDSASIDPDDISDKPAVFAVGVLSEALEARSNTSRASTDELASKTVGLLIGTVVLIPIVIAIGSLLAFALRKLDFLSGDVEAARLETEAVWNAIPDAMITVNRNGSIRRSNSQAATLFGYSESELQGMSVEDLLPVANRTAHIEHRSRFKSVPRVRPMGHGEPLMALHRDGREFAAQISLSYMRSAEELIAIATIRPVSQESVSSNSGDVSR